MKIKHSVITGFLGLQVDRFTQYQPTRSFAEKLEMAKGIPGIDGIEPVFPFEVDGSKESIQLIKDSGFRVSAVNLNLKQDPKWRRGSLTSRDPKLRADAVADMHAAMDVAAELGANMITCCPLIDGHDYAFQIDYTERWQWFVEGVRAGAKHRSDVRVSMEYKGQEPRTRTILPDVGRALHMCHQVGLPNVGVTMDVGHALAAGEQPAESLCLLAEIGKLFYVHLNDNPADWDWDMLPAAIHFWDFLEVMFYLDKLDWTGWFAYDVVSKEAMPVEAFAASIRIMDATAKLVTKLGTAKLQALIDDGLSHQTFEYLVTAML